MRAIRSQFEGVREEIHGPAAAKLLWRGRDGGVGGCCAGLLACVDERGECGLSDRSSKEYGRRFTDPLLRSFFGEGEMAELAVVALVFSLAWMNAENAGYPIGVRRSTGGDSRTRCCEASLERARWRSWRLLRWSSRLRG